MGCIYTTGPNRLMVIYGGCWGKKTKVKYIIGGWSWKWAAAEGINYIPLEVITACLLCKNVMTSLGVPLTASGVAHFKVMSSKEMLPVAAEHFLGRSVDQIRYTIKATLEGHLRAILATLSAEEALRDIHRFAALVKEIVTVDIGQMGIEIISLTISDLRDDNMYLRSLGRKDVATVKSIAAITAAECERDASKREHQCRREALEAIAIAKKNIHKQKLRYMLDRVIYEREMNEAKADAGLAYELQALKTRQEIEREKMEIDIIEKKKLTEIERMEVIRKEKTLVSDILLPAQAESSRVQTIAEAKKFEVIEQSKAESERIRIIGLSEAVVNEKLGKAIAEKMKLKAQAYKNFGSVAMTNVALTAISKLTAEICKPLTQIEEIVLLGNSPALKMSENILTSSDNDAEEY